MSSESSGQGRGVYRTGAGTAGTSDPERAPLLSGEGYASDERRQSGSDEVEEDVEDSVDNRKPRSMEHPSIADVVASRRLLSSNLMTVGEVIDAMTYQAQDLTNWSTLMTTSFAVWSRPSLWMMIGKLLALSLFTGIFALIVLPDYQAVQLDRSREVASFLRIFVGVLLGFFLSASVTRWWAAVGGFMKIADSLRNLQIELNSFGVPQKETVEVLRLGVLSTWVLHMNLMVEAQPMATQDLVKQKLLEQFKNGAGMDAVFSTPRQKEIQLLELVADPTSALWMWVSSLLGRMSQDGLLPPMASPTFGRLLMITHEAHSGMRSVRTSITCQAPFIYVQMLASLVHLNNIISALSFGFAWGSVLGVILHWMRIIKMETATEPTAMAIAQNLQSVLVTFCFCIFGPFIYQALLEVSIAIAQPFSSPDAAVPTERLLKSLEKDLHDGLMVADMVPWSKPCFKKD